MLLMVIPAASYGQSAPPTIPDSIYAPHRQEAGTRYADVTFYQLGLARANPHRLVKIVFTKRIAAAPAGSR